MRVETPLENPLNPVRCLRYLREVINWKTQETRRIIASPPFASKRRRHWRFSRRDVKLRRITLQN